MSTSRHIQLTLESEGWPAIADVFNSLESDALVKIREGDGGVHHIDTIEFVETIRNRIRALAKEAGVAQDPFRSIDG